MSVIVEKSPLAQWLDRFADLLGQCSAIAQSIDAMGPPPSPQDETELLQLLAIRRSYLPDGPATSKETTIASERWVLPVLSLFRAARHRADTALAEAERTAWIAASRNMSGLTTIPNPLPEAALTTTTMHPPKDSMEVAVRYAIVDVSFLPKDHPLRTLTLHRGSAVLPSVPGARGDMIPAAWFSISDVQALTQQFIDEDIQARKIAEAEHRAKHEQERRRQWLARPPEQRLAAIEEHLARQQPEILRDKPEFVPDPEVVALLEQTRRRQQEAEREAQAEREREQAMQRYLVSVGK